MLKDLFNFIRDAMKNKHVPTKIPSRIYPPPNDYLIQQVVRTCSDNPYLTDSGVAQYGKYMFQLDGCMDWYSRRIYYQETLIYESFYGVHRKERGWKNNPPDKVKHQLLKIIKKYS